MKIPTRFFCRVQRKIQYIQGTPQRQKNSKEVQLRGLKLLGNKQDLPNLIFFPDLFDQVENWLNFFLNQKHPILNHRNVYILYPRNFGLSDSTSEKIQSSELSEHLSQDLERFMYENQIGSATVGGHGLGAKFSLLLGCYRPELVTGFFGLNYSPLNYRYHNFAQEQTKIMNKLADLDLQKLNRSQILYQMEQIVQSPKMFKLLSDSLKFKKDQGYHFNFDVQYLAQNYEHLLNWEPRYGLFPGRASFMFSEHSDRVHIGSNTLPMYNICPKLVGFGRDVIRVQTESNHPDDNHWIYENQNLREAFLRHLEKFLVFYDGVHHMYRNVLDMEDQVKVRCIQTENKNGKNMYVPEHHHHNWRFNDMNK